MDEGSRKTNYKTEIQLPKSRTHPHKAPPLKHSPSPLPRQQPYLSTILPLITPSPTPQKASVAIRFSSQHDPCFADVIPTEQNGEMA